MMRYDFISYDGDYPTLCNGKLLLYDKLLEKVVEIDGLKSGGRCGFDEDWNEIVISAPYKDFIRSYKFSDDELKEILELINEHVEHGCCGGCI